MTWIKLNDNVTRHPKIARLSDRGFRWWVKGLCYASEFLTDGVLPDVFLMMVPRKTEEELLGAGLWYADDAERIAIHDYLKHQSSKASVERERWRNIERRTGGTTSGTPGGTPGGRTGKKPRPEIRDQRSETEISPLPPSGEGDSIRVGRDHRVRAALVQKAWLYRCKHDIKCADSTACVNRIARELAQTEKASA